MKNWEKSLESSRPLDPRHKTLNRQTRPENQPRIWENPHRRSSGDKPKRKPQEKASQDQRKPPRNRKNGEKSQGKRPRTEENHEKNLHEKGGKPARVLVITWLWESRVGNSPTWAAVCTTRRAGRWTRIGFSSRRPPSQQSSAAARTWASIYYPPQPCKSTTKTHQLQKLEKSLENPSKNLENPLKNMVVANYSLVSDPV